MYTSSHIIFIPRRPVLALIGVVACVSPSLRPPEASSVGAYVVRLGTDTIAVEEFVRTGNRLEGHLLRRSPVTTIYDYVVELGPDGRPIRFVVTPRRVDGTQPANAVRSATAAFGVDSAVIQTQRDTMSTQRVAAHEAYPTLPESFALYELWLSKLRSRGSDSATVMLVAPVGGPAGAMPVRMTSRDSAVAMLFGSPMRLAVDASGRLNGVDATATTLKNTVTRVPSANIDSLARHFAELDAAGRGLGSVISARDTVRATIGGANLMVDYGRPSKRGRRVFENGVLGDTLWRTGANAATQFRTDADLVIGGAAVPAGMYTLWTHIDGGQPELIVNRQTGQWGTVYDPAQDLIRIPLERRALPSPVEVFTIAIEPDGDAGVLKLQWDTTEFRVPITAK